MPSIKELAALPAPDVVEELSFDDIFLPFWLNSGPDARIFLRFWSQTPPSRYWRWQRTGKRSSATVSGRPTPYQHGGAGPFSLSLAFSSGGDLDHLGAFYGVARLVGEGDEALRRRIRQRIMGFSNAGEADLYRYWALTASPEIADVAVDSPQPGHVRISVLSRLNNGAASSSLIDAVKAVVLRDDIRVLTDTVHVLPAEVESLDSLLCR